MTSPMDPAISDVLSAQSQATHYAIAMKVAAKTQDAEKQEGEAAVQMIADAGKVMKQSIRTASGGVDTYA